MNKQDNSLWRDLIANLREQRRHIHALISLAREQTHVLAEANVERLAEITQQQASHLDEIDALEHQRKEVTRRIGESLGLRAHAPTLTDCACLAPENVARTLKWLQRELLQDTRQLQMLNERNRVLINHAAETVNSWLALVVNTAHNQMGYHSQATAGTAVVLNTEV
ncbi:MAG: flagellar protein FlgN [Armatimonadota bacterium]|nr:flagellar protein FlgN [bacterium]MDW8321426.1 flagellar protein FlgN [Armatimonadota bacterium]